MMNLRFGREEVTRTPDPYVPNVVRYQLRYFSVFGENLDYSSNFLAHFVRFDYLLAQIFSVFTKAVAKVLLFFDICK